LRSAGKEVRCNPGGFIIERSHEPYEFSHAEAADLWVMKVGQGARRPHPPPDRFCSCSSMPRTAPTGCSSTCCT
jgi:hypothetical protein